MSDELFPLSLVIDPAQCCLAVKPIVGVAYLDKDVAYLGIVCALIGATLVFEVRSST
jgi:hypothetical protein